MPGERFRLPHMKAIPGILGLIAIGICVAAFGAEPPPYAGTVYLDKGLIRKADSRVFNSSL